MAKRDRISFLFYEDWSEITEDATLSAEDRIAFVNALIRFSFDKIEPETLPLSIRYVFKLAKKRLERDDENRAEIAQKRSENGQKGMQKRWEKDEENSDSKSDACNDEIANDSKNNICYDSVASDNKNSKSEICNDEITNITVKEKEKEKEKEKDKESVREKPLRVFSPPSLEEVKKQVQEKNYTHVDAEYFWNYYESNGWMVGKSKMKKWANSLANWEYREKTNPKIPNYATHQQSRLESGMHDKGEYSFWGDKKPVE